MVVHLLLTLMPIVAWRNAGDAARMRIQQLLAAWQPGRSGGGQ